MSTDIATSITTIGAHDVMLWLHTRRAPSAAEWDIHIAKLLTAKEKRGDKMTDFRSLVISDGGHPTARERKIIFAEVFGRGRTPFAAVSVDLTNPVLRGVATVIAWLQPGFKAFQPDDALKALEHVGLAAEVDRVLAEFDTLQTEFPPVRTLALVKSALGKRNVGSHQLEHPRPK